MRCRFDSELDLLKQKLERMGTLCEVAIEKASQSLLKNDKTIAREIFDIDNEIDQLEKDIEHLCLKLLLQQQPVARDLRQISAALKMITDMERIGDQTADIADIVLSADLNVQNDSLYNNLSSMAQKTVSMVRKSILAYVEKDLILAKKVIESDDEVDTLFAIIKKELIEHISQDKGEKSIDLIMVAKYLERIGDHATNIAEWVEFSITGIHNSSEQTR